MRLLRAVVSVVVEAALFWAALMVSVCIVAELLVLALTLLLNL